MTTTSALDRAATLTLEGRFAQALAVLDQTRPAAVSGPWTILRGELLERVGKFAQSKQLINGFLKGGRRSAGEQSACEFTLGKIKWDEGETGPALAHLQRAVALATKDGDLRRKCWANLWLLTLVADRSGPDAAAPILSEIRKDVIKLGDARVMSALHAFAAQMDAKRGLFRSALAQVRASRDLLTAGPNLWLEALLEYTQSNIAVLRSEHDAALVHGRRAVELAEESGAAVSLRTCLASLSVVFYALGRFDDAVACLSRGMSILPTTGDIRCGMIDTLTRIRLAEANVEQCASLLDDATDSSSDMTDRLLYGRRYLSLTRSQVLGRRGDYQQALSQIDDTLSVAHESQDKLLGRVALLTKSQLLQESRNISDALKLLDGFLAGNLTGQSPEIYAQYETILACSLASVGRCQEGQTHRDRAGRIYQGLAHAPGSIELVRCWDRCHQDIWRGEWHCDVAVRPVPEDHDARRHHSNHCVSSVARRSTGTISPRNCRSSRGHRHRDTCSGNHRAR